MAQNDSEQPILPDSQLFQSFPTKVAQNDSEQPICPIHNFSNLFPPKWLRMTQNGQFSMAKIKYTLIQGNFYERLLFYMDSCALSPMASLLNLKPSQDANSLTMLFYEAVLRENSPTDNCSLRLILTQNMLQVNTLTSGMNSIYFELERTSVVNFSVYLQCPKLLCPNLNLKPLNFLDIYGSTQQEHAVKLLGRTQIDMSCLSTKERRK